MKDLEKVELLEGLLKDMYFLRDLTKSHKPEYLYKSDFIIKRIKEELNNC
jgi:hypothetical protein